MKTLRVVKFIVFVMTALIVCGFIVIALKLSEMRHKNKPEKQTATRIFVDEKSGQPQTSGCGQYVCVTTKTNDNQTEILIIDPKKGTTLHKITISTTQN